MKNAFKTPITLPYSRGAYVATPEQAAQLFTTAEIEKGECRFELVTVGPWSLLTSCRGLIATSQTESKAWGTDTVSITFYGKRTLSKPRPNGYGIVGTMRFAGKSCRIIDTNLLVQIEGGKLVSVSVLHVCK